MIMAPATTEKSSSDKRKKTDRCDAKMRAMALIDAYRFVYVPDDEDKRVHKGTQQPKEEAVADKAEAAGFSWFLPDRFYV